MAKNKYIDCGVSLTLSDKAIGKVTIQNFNIATVSLMKKYLGKSILKRNIDYIGSKTLGYAYNIGKLIGKTTTKQFDEAAKNLINYRYRRLLFKRFDSARENWPPLKKESVYKRIYRVNIGWPGNIYGPPLVFTGNLKHAWIDNHKISNFEFFSKADFKKGFLKFKPFKITAVWTSRAERSVFSEYWKGTTLIEPKFWHLGVYHSKLGRRIPPHRGEYYITNTGRKIVYKPKKWYRNVIYQDLIKPFIHTDFKRLFFQMVKYFSAGKKSSTRKESIIVKRTMENTKEKIIKDLENFFYKEAGYSREEIGAILSDVISKIRSGEIKVERLEEITKYVWDLIAESMKGNM